MSLKKRILSCACALALTAGFAASLPQGFDRLGVSLDVCAETYGDFEYTVLNDGTVEISKYNGTDANVVIPSKIGGKKVTSIGDSAFSYCSSLTSVTIPDSVKNIGGSAFCNCIGLTSVSIPGSVESTGLAAFYGCTSLTSVTIPDGVKNISVWEFGMCFNLSSVTIPDSVTSIDIFAFQNCSSLKEITIPSSVTSIGERAFGWIVDEKIDGFKVYCYAGTAGEQYAIDNGFDCVLLGDANKDGKQNMKDLVLIQRHLNGWNS